MVANNHLESEVASILRSNGSQQRVQSIGAMVGKNHHSHACHPWPLNAMRFPVMRSGEQLPADAAKSGASAGDQSASSWSVAQSVGNRVHLCRGKHLRLLEIGR